MRTELQPIPPDDPGLTQTSIDVEICDTQAFFPVSAVELSRLVRRVLIGEGRHLATISLALVDDATIHRINRQHLGHDWPTDVISFILSDPAEPELAGELVISAEMAQAAARELGVDPLEELSLYAVHGLLHLCGYDDIEPDDRQRMREREGRVLRRLGLTNTFPMGERCRSAGDQRGRAAWSG